MPFRLKYSLVEAGMKSAQTYYPGGSIEAGRMMNSSAYRFGQNTQEADMEISGTWGTHYTAEFWGDLQYDARLMRRWNVDPVMKPWESPYLCFCGNPIFYIDPRGDNSGDYYRYNKQTKKMEHIGSDKIIDGKSYILKEDGTVTSVTEDNYKDVQNQFVQFPAKLTIDYLNKMWNIYKNKRQYIRYAGNLYYATGYDNKKGFYEIGLFEATKETEVMTVEAKQGDYAKAGDKTAGINTTIAKETGKMPKI